jgi:hypothetical protein
MLLVQHGTFVTIRSLDLLAMQHSLPPFLSPGGSLIFYGRDLIPHFPRRRRGVEKGGVKSNFPSPPSSSAAPPTALSLLPFHGCSGGGGSQYAFRPSIQIETPVPAAAAKAA